MHRFALCALVLALGCVDENPSLIVTGVLAPEQEMGCTWSCNSTSSDLLIPSGVYDPAIDGGTGYFAGVCVANFRVNNATGGSGFAGDTGRVLFQRANIELFGVGGESLNLAYSVPLANSVASAADVTTPGTQAVVVTLIPPEVGQFLLTQLDAIVAQTGSSTLLVSFTIAGETTGGIDVESSPSTFPVAVVNTDLVCQSPVASDDFVGPCALGVDSAFEVIEGSTLATQLEAQRGAPLLPCL
ncbi:MAG: hypothetical protein AAF447_16260 [Myxococcota bacterium]